MFNISQTHTEGNPDSGTSPPVTFAILVWINGCCGPQSSRLVGRGVVMPIEARVEELRGIGGQGLWMSTLAATHTSLCEALKHLQARALTQRPIYVITGSRLVWAQIHRRWTGGGGRYLPFYREALRLAERCASLSYLPGPHPNNCRAHRLARTALAATGRGR